MKEPAISIIVPIYKVEQYLSQCIDSIITQSFCDFELLLINDGSPDNCGKICDEYAVKDSRIRVFHIENGGVAQAREYGVNQSCGEYITFVDSDDLLPVNSIEILFQNMDDNIDVVIGSILLQRGNDSRYVNLGDNIIDRGLLLKYQITQEPIFFGSPWCKLYRRTLFNAHSFPKMHRGEDFLMNIELSINIRKAKVISDIVYEYCIRNTSISQNNNPDSLYWEKYTTIVSNTLKRAHLYSDNEYHFYIMKMVLIFKSIYRQVPISYKDSWAYDTLIYFKKHKLPLKYRVALTSIKYSLLQKLIMKAFRIKLRVNKFVR